MTGNLFQLFLLSAIWGSSFLLIKVAGTALPPLWVAAVRLAVGAGFLWLVLLRGGHRLPPRRLLGPLLLVALFNNAIPFTFFAWGEQSVPSSLAAVLNATTPLWTLLIAVSRREVAIYGAAALGVALGFVGVALAMSGDLGRGQASALGVLLIAVASLCYAVATAVAKHALRGLDPIGLATTQLSLAGLMVTPLALAGPWPASVPLGPLLAVLTLGVVGSGVAYQLYYGLLARVSATQVASVTYLLPVWGLFWGVLAGERLALTAPLGVVIALAGLYLLNRPVRPAGARA